MGIGIREYVLPCDLQMVVLTRQHKIRYSTTNSPDFLNPIVKCTRRFGCVCECGGEGWGWEACGADTLCN